jgi:hypothetical protein
MHVYLRWYEQGKPRGEPQLMESEDAARAAVLQRFPAAAFSTRIKTALDPNTFMLEGVEEMMYAWPRPHAPGLDAVADILFPPP